MLSKPDATLDQTGSIGGTGGEHAERVSSAAAPSETDLAYARATAAEILAHGAEGNSIPWQNPHTGAGGNITPLSSTSSEGGMPCRGFLASYVRSGAQTWLQGSACRTSRGAWEVKSLKPFKSS
jgi:surface antigen